MNNQLSNIIEEKSEIHNISSIKSSNLIQNIKVRKQTCNLCGLDGVDIDESKLSKYQNILIYPCLCPFVAHRNCIKSFIIENQISTCPTCKTNYAVGRSSINVIGKITPTMIQSWIGKFMLFFIFIIMIIIFILFTNGFSSSNALITVWKGVLFILFGIILILSLIHAGCSIKIAFKRLRRSEIEIYCNQTEIGYHSQNPKDILKDYFENNLEYIYENMKNRSYEKKKYNQNNSLAKKKSESRNQKDQKFQHPEHEDDEEPLSKILNFATDQENNDNKIKAIDTKIVNEVKSIPKVNMIKHEKKKSVEIEKISKKIEEISPIPKKYDPSKFTIDVAETFDAKKPNKRAKSVEKLKSSQKIEKIEDDHNSIALNFSYENKNYKSSPNKEETLSLSLTIAENQN